MWLSIHLATLYTHSPYFNMGSFICLRTLLLFMLFICELLVSVNTDAYSNVFIQNVIKLFYIAAKENENSKCIVVIFYALCGK